jgi:hypothetical protein
MNSIGDTYTEGAEMCMENTNKPGKCNFVRVENVVFVIVEP